jgi:hypothetical protein
MSNRNTIRDELNELNSGLNPNSNKHPYSVPEGYFEGLSDSILAKIKGESTISTSDEIAVLSPLLASISRKLPYSIPSDYFQSNIESLNAIISQEEESLILSFVEKEMPYQVPLGYFTNFPEQVLEKIADQKKVVPLVKRRWMRLAAAAVVTGVMAISGIFYFNSRGDNTTTDPVTAVKKASTEELNDFIKTTAIDGTDEKAQITVRNKGPKTESKIFADVSDKELNAFLDQMPADDEININ